MTLLPSSSPRRRPRLVRAVGAGRDGADGCRRGHGLTVAEVDRRLAEYGPNELPTEPPPSMWAVARGQLVNPMNIMLLFVVAASFAIVQIATALVVLGLVLFNVVMGTNQELKARASVEALAKLQVPHARVRRSGQVEEIESTKLVPGDIVPAGGRRRGPGRRADHLLGDAGGAGGRADRGERAGAQGPGDVARGRDRAGRPHQPGVPEHPGHPRHDDIRGDRDRQRDRDGPDRRHGDGHQADQVAAAT